MAKGRPIYPEEEARIVRLWQSGMNYADIGREIGRAYNVVSRAVQRVVRREAARGVILTQKNAVRVCPYCGREFEITPSSPQKYCCEEHMRIANGNRKVGSESEKARVMIAKPVKDPATMRDGRTPTLAEVAIKTDRERSKWGEIAKKCAALGMSYGEAIARGLL